MDHLFNWNQHSNLNSSIQSSLFSTSSTNDNEHYHHQPCTPPHLRLSSPKTPPTVIRRRSSISSKTSSASSISDMSETEENKLQPLSTYRLKPITQKVKNMVMSLTESGVVCLEFIKTKNGVEKIVETFTVSKDGEEIIIICPRESKTAANNGDLKRSKTFSVSNLPERYHKKYDHARKFISLVQSKTPKITMYNQQAKCMLMENSPNPNFEVQFYSGRKIINNWSGMKLVDEGQGCILSLSSPRIQHQFSQEIQNLIKFTEQWQEQCLQFEALINSTRNSSYDKHTLFPVVIGKRPVPKPVTMPTQTVQSLNQNNNSNTFTMTRQLATFIQSDISSSHVSMATENHHVNSSCMSSNSSASCSSETESNIIGQIRVPTIGLASQLQNGDIWVEFEDGSHLGIKPSVTTVTYINQHGTMTKFRKSEPLPDNVKVKLASVPIVLEKLMSQKTEMMLEQNI